MDERVATMNGFSFTDYLRTRGGRHVSILLFVLMVGTIIYGLVFATRKVDYVWRWYRIPQYFFYQEQIEVRADLEGEVASVTSKADGVDVAVRGSSGEEIYRVPANGLRVQRGETVYPGDVLAVQKRWKVGILLEGLWTTVEVSVIAVLLGILIGLFT